MTLENPAQLDVVGMDASGRVLLIIVETRPWDSSWIQLRQLRRKIDAYHRFVLSGQLVRMYPEARGRPICVNLQCVETPPKSVSALLEEAGTTLLVDGLQLEVSVR